MEYRFNPDKLRSMFAVPAEVVDRHIKLASAAQLKVLLWLLRNGPDAAGDADEMGGVLGIPAQDAADALLYWENAGILLRAGSAQAPAAQEAAQTAGQSAAPAAKAAPRAVAKPIKPTREEVALRGTESPEIAYLLNQAQLRFGRLLRQNEASTLVWLHDHEGVPVPVLLMLIEYAAGEHTLTAGFLERTAVKWVNEGVLDVASAERSIIEMRAQKDAWRIVCNAMGLERRRPSAKEQTAAVRWVQEWGFSADMLRKAYDACVDQIRRFDIDYINSILKDWHKHGIGDPEALARYEQHAKAAAKGGRQKPDASYDLELVEEKLFGVK